MIESRRLKMMRRNQQKKTSRITRIIMRQVILPRVAAPPFVGSITREQFPHKSPHKSQSGNSCFEAKYILLSYVKSSKAK